MATYRPEDIVTQSVLDRLIDDAPDQSQDPPTSRRESMRALRTALKRDLEWLLNSRSYDGMKDLGDQAGELTRSLLNYGLPDISSMSVQSASDHQRLQLGLAETIELFEPRLTEVEVFLEPVSLKTRTLRFRIEAMLMVDPAPEQIRFDTVLELSSGEYSVKGDRGA
jgi:type VI secretion system protein ImpF